MWQSCNPISPAGRKRIARCFNTGRTSGGRTSPVRDGRTPGKSIVISFVPDGTGSLFSPAPPMNRWAMVFRPAGLTQAKSSRRARFVQIGRPRFRPRMDAPACAGTAHRDLKGCIAAEFGLGRNGFRQGPQDLDTGTCGACLLIQPCSSQNIVADRPQTKRHPWAHDAPYAKPGQNPGRLRTQCRPYPERTRLLPG